MWIVPAVLAALALPLAPPAGADAAVPGTLEAAPAAVAPASAGVPVRDEVLPPVLRRAAASVVRERIGGERAIVATPHAPTDRVVIFSHGAGRQALGLMVNAGGVVAPLLDRGYTVVSSDAHGDAWGNRASRRDHVEVAREMRRRGLRRVFMVARSMGGLASLATIHRIRPVAWAGIYPACNLRSLPPRFHASIERAHGLRWRQIARARALNPVAPRGVAGLRMLFWHSPGDTVVPKRHNTDLCATQAERAGARVRVVVTRGDHGDPSNFDGPRLAAFFDAAARRRHARAS